MGRYDALLGDDTVKPATPEKRPEQNRHRKAPDRKEEVKDFTASLAGDTSTDMHQTALFNKRTIKPVPAVRDVRPVLPVRDVRGGKRVMKNRHPFDIYEDQYQSLKELGLQDRMQGGMGSMSAMVRDALDTYIEKRRKK